MDRVHTFNENFDQWRESNSSEENVSFVKDLYRDMPEMFSEDHMAPLSEELTYTCYRTGTLISIAAITVGGVLTVIGIVREIRPLAVAGIALAALGVIFFIIAFIRAGRSLKQV